MKNIQNNSNQSDENRAIRLAFLLNFGFTIIEIIGGLWTNSIAILSDALHDLADTISLSLSWYMERYSRKERDKKYSYGYKRYSMLGALINIFIIIAGSLFVLSEAVPRLLQPQPAKVPGMILFASIGIIVNGFSVLRLRKGKTLNARVATWHLMEDVLGWIAVLIISIVLLFSDIYILDPILSILITIFILINIIRNLKSTLTLFLQAIPEHIDIDNIEKEFLTFNKVKSSHHTHCWSLDGKNHVLTTHVVVDKNATKDEVLQIKCKIKSWIEKLGFEHLTIEIEYEGEICILNDLNNHNS
jgi:cobalt-zinc-cadmium efflux system protein